MFDDFDTQRQSDEYGSIYGDSDVDYWEDVWSDFLEQMTYAND